MDAARDEFDVRHEESNGHGAFFIEQNGKRVALFGLATGACTAARTGPYAGRDSGETALAREMLQCAPIGLVHTIANARLVLDADEPTAIAAIPAMAAAVQSTADFAEGIASFLERRPARFIGR